VERVVDAHIHFWDQSIDGLRWAFLDPTFDHPRLGRLKELAAPRYAAAELRADIGAVDLDKFVHVQAAAASGDPVVETAWLQTIADGARSRGEKDWPTAIVGYCNLADPDTVTDVIERHRQHDRFRGIRDLASGMRLRDPATIDGYRHAAATGATIEVMTSWDHYDAFAAVVDSAPPTQWVLGHSGLPTERDDAYYAQWIEGLRGLARRVPGLVCKISALASGADPNWTVDSIRRWVLGCIEAFGTDRCMFASNWPVDKLFGRYPDLYAAYEAIVRAAGCTEDEVDALFASNAERVYAI
jgi:predicted TIM-barrel fold metal-dependent hydrolase